jgi:energy-converting hydrogenase Eha subunit A
MAQSQDSNRFTFEYQIPPNLFVPEAWFWAGVGGLAVGIAAAVTLTLLGATGGLLFSTVLIVVGLISGFLIYLVFYLGPALRRKLKVTLDYDWGTVSVRRPGTGSRPARFAFSDVLLFRTVELARGCAVIMETNSGGPLTLVTTRRDCAAGLDQLTAHLNAHLEAIHAAAEDDTIPYDPGETIDASD